MKISLDRAQAGQKVRIISIRADRRGRMAFRRMGLSRGAEITVTAAASGFRWVKTERALISLGKGSAARIIVRQLKA